jgi:hypothetical protein
MVLARSAVAGSAALRATQVPAGQLPRRRRRRRVLVAVVVVAAAGLVVAAMRVTRAPPARFRPLRSRATEQLPVMPP